MDNKLKQVRILIMSDLHNFIRIKHIRIAFNGFQKFSLILSLGSYCKNDVLKK